MSTQPLTKLEPSDTQINCRFLDPSEYWKLEEIFKEHNSSELPEPQFSKVAIIELDETEEIIGFFNFEIFPFAGPMWIKEEFRNSHLWAKLVEMILPLTIRKSTYVIASQPETQEMCERMRLRKIESPVYVLEKPKL